MYVVIWDSPAGLYSYGPFDDQAESQGWVDTIRPFLTNISEHRLMGCVVVPPDLDSWDDVPPGKEVGSFYHQGRDRDDDEHRSGFIVALVRDVLSFAIGPFPTREEAEQWFLRHRTTVGGASGLVLPFLHGSRVVRS
jgi:hypothetical protein